MIITVRNNGASTTIKNVHKSKLSQFIIVKIESFSKIKEYSIKLKDDIVSVIFSRTPHYDTVVNVEIDDCEFDLKPFTILNGKILSLCFVNITNVDYEHVFRN